MTGKEDVMATTETFVPDRLYDMPLAKLQPDSNQPRKYIDPAALDELTASIREHGVIEPVLFRVEKGIRFTVAGDRRCAAARQAGLKTIPAIFTDAPRYEEITAKKQERSMLKAFEAYKTSLNPVKREKAGEAATTAQSTVKSMDATGKRIEAMASQNLSPEEKEALATAMNGLKGILEIALAAITKPEMPEMDEPPGEKDLKSF
jgi:ParB/RepB/Spo0J family partition protein